MGNQIGLPLPPRKEVDYLTDLPRTVFKEYLGGGRLMKTLRCIHDDWGQVVIKAYYKRGDTTSLRPYEKMLDEIRERLAGLAAPQQSHVLPFYEIVELDRAAFLFRPYVYANLYLRLSSRPFLGDVEKRWIAFQLLVALAQAHERNVCHGDIKTENVLLTSSCWLYLVDFAPYKPAHLPADNPADYSYFYDTGGRRRCYLAPERFYGDSDTAQLSQEPLRWSMDIFSAGCVLAEMFNDGTELFDLGKLLAYRRNEHNPAPSLARLDPHIRDLILHMIQLDPGARLSASEYLSIWGPTLFPAYFEPFLHPFLHKVLQQDPDARLNTVASSMPLLVQEMQVGGTNLGTLAPAALEGPPGTQEAACGNPTASPLDKAAAEPSALPRQGLLANVEFLQMDVQDLLVRLTDAEERAHQPDQSGSFFAGDYTLPDEEEELSHYPSPQRGPKREFDVATREFLEFQYCVGPGMAFMPRDVESPGAGTQQESILGGPPQAREDVTLPDPVGWIWTSEWQVDRQSGPTDHEGFMYRRAGNDVSPAGPGPSTLRALYGWSPQRGPNDNWRRRRWIRRCQRSPLPSSQVQVSGLLGSFRGKSHGMVLIAGLLCASLRGARYLESKLKGIHMLAEAAELCDDDTRLQRIVPYLLAMVGDTESGVRVAALRGLAAVLHQVVYLPPTDLKIFNEYILPSLSLVPSDPEEWVRVEFAGAVADLASSGLRLLMGLHHSADQPQPPDPNAPDVLKYEEEVGQLRGAVEKVVHEVAVGLKSSSATRRALLRHLPTLLSFLGRKDTNDFLLPAMITFLNDRDWLLRADFFRHMSALAAVSGPAGLHAFLMPCLEQALADEEDGVIAEAVNFLTVVTQRQQLPQSSLLKAAAKVAPALLRHPSCAVRGAVLDFLAAAARELPPARAYAQLLPLVLPACTSEPLSLQEPALVSICLRPPEERAHKKASLPADPPLPNRKWGPREPGGSTPPAAAILGPPLPEAAAIPAATLVEPPSSDSHPKREDAPLLLKVEEELPKYVMHVDSTWQRPGMSRLSATLEFASALPIHASRIQPPTSDLQDPRLASVAALVGAAKRLAPEPTKMRLNPSLLSSEQPVSFQAGEPFGRGLETLLDVAVHTDNEAQGYAGAPVPAAPWHPRGILIANLVEHKGGVNKVAVAENHAFVASASNDQTVKVWDVRRFERDVTFASRLTYAGQSGRILSCCACEDNQGVASGSSNGSLHVWRVEYTCTTHGAPDQYRGIVGSKQADPKEGAVLQMAYWAGLLLYVTQRGGVHAWDLRAPRDAWRLPCRPNLGQLDHLVCDPGGPNWLVTGSSLGCLTLWDARFQLNVFSWDHPLRGPIGAMAPVVAPATRLMINGKCPSCPLVYVAAGGNNEVGLWDVEQGRCHQVLRSHALGQSEGWMGNLPEALKKPQSLAVDPTDPESLSRHLHVTSFLKPPARQGAVRSLLTTGGGMVITGADDCCIRLLGNSVERDNHVLSGPPLQPNPCTPGPQAPRVPVQYTYRWAEVGVNGMQGVNVLEEICTEYQEKLEKSGSGKAGSGKAAPSPLKAALNMTARERAAARCHRDAVVDLASVSPDPALPNRVLVSGSLDGTVKVWK